MEGLEYRVEVNVVLSRILMEGEQNKQMVDADVYQIVNSLNEKHVGYEIKYRGLDIDAESVNKIYVRLSYTTPNYNNNNGVEDMGKTISLNFVKDILKDKGLSEYKVESNSYQIKEIMEEGSK